RSQTENYTLSLHDALPICLEKQIEINAMHYSEQLVQQLNSRLDAYFEDLERSSLPVIVHPLVQQLMEISIEKEEYQYFHLSERRSEEHTSELQSRENLVCR